MNPLLDLLHQIRDAEEGTDLAPLFEQLETGIEGQETVLSGHLTTIGERDETIKDLKGKNYDLLQKIPVDEKQLPKQQETETEDKPITVDSLFKKSGGE